MRRKREPFGTNVQKCEPFRIINKAVPESANPLRAFPKKCGPFANLLQKCEPSRGTVQDLNKSANHFQYLAEPCPKVPTLREPPQKCEPLTSLARICKKVRTLFLFAGAWPQVRTLSRFWLACVQKCEPFANIFEKCEPLQ